MKYAVIGGKGFVGSAIAAEVEARGHNLTIIDVDEYESAVGSTFDVLINANGNSRKYLAKREPAKEFDLSVRSVAHALQDFTAARTVHLSTIDVYADCTNPSKNSEDTVIDPGQLSPYGFHKYLAEQLVRYYAKDWLIFRMAGFVGPRLWKNSIYDLLSGSQLYVHPDSEYQYLHTSELAKIVLDVVDKGISGETFNIAGEGVVSLRQIAELIPEANLANVPAEAQQERYEVSIDKIKAYRQPPRTEDTVSAFVRAVLNGEEALA